MKDWPFKMLYIHLNLFPHRGYAWIFPCSDPMTLAFSTTSKCSIRKQMTDCDNTHSQTDKIHLSVF